MTTQTITLSVMCPGQHLAIPVDAHRWIKYGSNCNEEFWGKMIDGVLKQLETDPVFREWAFSGSANVGVDEA